MPVLRALELNKSFGTVTAVCGINLDIEAGAVVGLVGPDGAGKSTLLRLFMGLLRPTSGKVTIDGLDVERDAARVKEAVGYMPQHFSLYGDLTVAENMRFFADLYGVEREAFVARRAELLRFSALAPFEDRPARQLSGGMQKKLALACNLFHTPRVLFLDEPTTGVDPVSRRELWALLGQLNQSGTTIVLSTPYMDEAARCHRVALIFEGRLLAYGTPAAVVAAMKGEIAELLAPVAPALAALRGRPGIRSAHPFGDTVHIVLDPGFPIETVRTALAERGVPLITLRSIPPSFEDAFLALSQRQESWHS